MSKKKLIFDEAGWLSDEIMKQFKEYAGIDPAAISSQEMTATQIIAKTDEAKRLYKIFRRDVEEIRKFFCTMPQIDFKADEWFGQHKIYSGTLSENPLIIASHAYEGWTPGFYTREKGWNTKSKVLFTGVNWPAMSWKRALLTRLHPERFLQRNAGIPGSTVDRLIWIAKEERNIRTLAVVATLEKTITY